MPQRGRWREHHVLTSTTRVSVRLDLDSAAARQRVLVVDDDESISLLVANALRYEGFEVRNAFNGSQALSEATAFAPDLIVLDVMLPDIDGFEVQRLLAADGSCCPIMFLTGRDATADKVRALTLGADDYVTKPFSLDELAARVRAVLRRRRGQPRSGRLQVADLELDLDCRDVRRSGCEVKLSPTEFNLLSYLMLNVGRVVTKPQIIDHVWRADFGGDHQIVGTYIAYLRRKVDFTTPKLIHTKRGVGYTLQRPLP